jgi:hypothetical protein
LEYKLIRDKKKEVNGLNPEKVICSLFENIYRIFIAKESLKKDD